MATTIPTIGTGEQEVTADPRLGLGLKAPRGTRVTFKNPGFHDLTLEKVSDIGNTTTDWVPVSSGDSYKGSVLRYYLDYDVGNDQSNGLSNAFPLKTFEEAFERIPRDGHGGVLELLCKPRAGGAAYLNKTGGPDAIRFDRLTGYDWLVARGSDLSNSATDHVVAGARTIAGPFVVDATSPTQPTEWDTTSALPAETSGLTIHSRVRFSTGVLAGQAFKLYKVSARAAFPFDADSHLTIAENVGGTPPSPGDEFVLELPGLYVDQVVLPPGQNVQLAGVSTEIIGGTSGASPRPVHDFAEVSLAFCRLGAASHVFEGGAKFRSDGYAYDPVGATAWNLGHGCSVLLGGGIAVQDTGSVDMSASRAGIGTSRCGTVNLRALIARLGLSATDCATVGLGGDPSTGTFTQPCRADGPGGGGIDIFTFTRCARVDVQGARFDYGPGSNSGFGLHACARVSLLAEHLVGSGDVAILVNMYDDDAGPSRLFFGGLIPDDVPVPGIVPSTGRYVQVIEDQGFSFDVTKLQTFSDLGVSPVRTTSGQYIALEPGFRPAPNPGYNGEDVGVVEHTIGITPANAAYEAFRVVRVATSPVVATAATQSNQFGVTLVANPAPGGGDGDVVLVVCKGPAWVRAFNVFTADGRIVYAAAGGAVTDASPGSVAHTQVGRAIAFKTVDGLDYVLVDVNFVNVAAVVSPLIATLEETLTNDSGGVVGVGEIVTFADAPGQAKFKQPRNGVLGGPSLDPLMDTDARNLGVAITASAHGATARIATHGRVSVQFIAGLPVPLPMGARVYLAPNLTGTPWTSYQATIDASAFPADGQWLVPIGYVKNGATYTGSAGDLALIDLFPDSKPKTPERTIGNIIKTNGVTATLALEIPTFEDKTYILEIDVVARQAFPQVGRGHFRDVVGLFVAAGVPTIDDVAHVKAWTNDDLVVSYAVTASTFQVYVQAPNIGSYTWAVACRLTAVVAVFIPA